MQNRKFDPRSPRISEEDEDMFETVVSSSECTGLVPAMPETEEELDNIENLYELSYKSKGL